MAALGSGGSLFDIAAPEAVASTPTESPAPEPEPEPDAGARGGEGGARSRADALLRGGAEPGRDVLRHRAGGRDRRLPRPSRPATTGQSPTPDPEPETEQADEPEERREKPKPASSSEAHTPKTDVDINESGSLFDL